MFEDEKYLTKAFEEQKRLHKKGVISIIEINSCRNSSIANNLMIENNCNEIMWIN